MIVGATAAGFTVSVAELLVTLPTELLTTTLNVEALSALVVAGIAPVAEVISAPRPPEPTGPPVRITNAFDTREVFEFPYGTSESEARAAAEELLLNRARERGTKGTALRQAKSTRLLARTKVALNGTN